MHPHGAKQKVGFTAKGLGSSFFVCFRFVLPLSTSLVPPEKAWKHKLSMGVIVVIDGLSNLQNRASFRSATIILKR